MDGMFVRQRTASRLEHIWLGNDQKDCYRAKIETLLSVCTVVMALRMVLSSMSPLTVFLSNAPSAPFFMASSNKKGLESWPDELKI